MPQVITIICFGQWAMVHFFCARHFIKYGQIRTVLENFFKSKTTKFYAEGIHLIREKWKKVINNSCNYKTKSRSLSCLIIQTGFRRGLLTLSERTPIGELSLFRRKKHSYVYRPWQLFCLVWYFLFLFNLICFFFLTKVGQLNNNVLKNPSVESLAKQVLKHVLQIHITDSLDST